jgi:predicted ArsR family transcriptional regulator
MPLTSRQKILDYLKRNRTASSREVARVLRMTPANARRHLGILAADGRVEVVSQRGAGRGRPGKAYRLSGALAGDNLSALAEALLAEAGASVGMEALGRRLAGEGIPSHLPSMRRLAAAVERLNGMHYQARWEAGAEGPRIILGHCPYAAVVGKRPELCRMDAALLGSLSGGEALQVAKMEPGGTQPCVFLLGRA